MACDQDCCSSEMGDSPQIEEELCRCPGGMSEKFIIPCLLLLLHQKESHGYALMNQLSALGVTADASVVYRSLRRLEKQGSVESHWETQSSGPAKRAYRLTAEGEDLLHTWVPTIERNKKVLDKFLSAYKENFPLAR